MLLINVPIRTSIKNIKSYYILFFFITYRIYGMFLLNCQGYHYSIN